VGLTNRVWNAIDFNHLITALPRTKLPECNRGSWYCPVATQDDAQTLDYLCRKEGVSKVYDLGAGTLELSVEMDRRGYDVVAYESIKHLTEYALERLPDNSVEVRNRDYYADWGEIRNENAAFVALGMVNSVPGRAPNGITVDGMSVDK